MKKSIAVLGLGRFGQFLTAALAKNGADVLIADDDEETVRKLLFRSAKEDLPNKKGETPLQLAARAGNLDMVKRLLNMNVKVTPAIVNEAKTQEIKDLLSAKLKK